MKSITIPAPRAYEGEKVMVQNYRRSNKDWESGEVYNVVFQLGKERGYNIGRYTYSVLLDRRTPTSDAPPTTNRKVVVRLYVGDDGIKKI